MGIHNCFKLFLDNTTEDSPYLHFTAGALPEFKNNKLNLGNVYGSAGLGFNIGLNNNILNLTWNFLNLGKN